MAVVVEVPAATAAADAPRAAVSPAFVDAATALAVVHALVVILSATLRRMRVAIVGAFVWMAGGPSASAVFAAGRLGQWPFFEVVLVPAATHGTALLLVELLLIIVIFVVF